MALARLFSLCASSLVVVAFFLLKSTFIVQLSKFLSVCPCVLANVLHSSPNDSEKAAVLKK